MNIDERMHLLAEQKFLQERLAAFPDSASITRISTESRLRAIEKELEHEPISDHMPARVRLTFSGRPVIGSHGIFAEFGMKAISAFTDTVVALAASLSAPLAAMGLIPNREQHQLLITNTALGSFGFELEEHRDGQLFLVDESPVAQALEQTQNLLQSTVGTDDQLADCAADTDLLALGKMLTFFQTLADHEAVCTVQYEDRGFRFADVG